MQLSRIHMHTHMYTRTFMYIYGELCCFCCALFLWVFGGSKFACSRLVCHESTSNLKRIMVCDESFYSSSSLSKSPSPLPLLLLSQPTLDARSLFFFFWFLLSLCTRHSLVAANGESYSNLASVGSVFCFVNFYILFSGFMVLCALIGADEQMSLEVWGSFGRRQLTANSPLGQF